MTEYVVYYPDNNSTWYYLMSSGKWTIDQSKAARFDEVTAYRVARVFVKAKVLRIVSN